MAVFLNRIGCSHDAWHVAGFPIFRFKFFRLCLLNVERFCSAFFLHPVSLGGLYED